MLDSLRQDLRFATRSLLRRPLFLLIPVLSLSPVIALDRYTRVSLLPQRIAGTLVPARRAASVDPAESLREE